MFEKIAIAFRSWSVWFGAVLVPAYAEIAPQLVDTLPSLAESGLVPEGTIRHVIAVIGVTLALLRIRNPIPLAERGKKKDEVIS
jgi:hypothetical protein